MLFFWKLVFSLHTTVYMDSRELVTMRSTISKNRELVNSGLKSYPLYFSFSPERAYTQNRKFSVDSISGILGLSSKEEKVAIPFFSAVKSRALCSLYLKTIKKDLLYDIALVLPDGFGPKERENTIKSFLAAGVDLKKTLTESSALLLSAPIKEYTVVFNTKGNTQIVKVYNQKKKIGSTELPVSDTHLYALLEKCIKSQIQRVMEEKCTTDPKNKEKYEKYAKDLQEGKIELVYSGKPMSKDIEYFIGIEHMIDEIMFIIDTVNKKKINDVYIYKKEGEDLNVEFVVVGLDINIAELKEEVEKFVEEKREEINDAVTKVQEIIRKCQNKEEVVQPKESTEDKEAPEEPEKMNEPEEEPVEPEKVNEPEEPKVEPAEPEKVNEPAEPEKVNEDLTSEPAVNIFLYGDIFNVLPERQREYFLGGRILTRENLMSGAIRNNYTAVVDEDILNVEKKDFIYFDNTLENLEDELKNFRRFFTELVKREVEFDHLEDLEGFSIEEIKEKSRKYSASEVKDILDRYDTLMSINSRRKIGLEKREAGVNALEISILEIKGQKKEVLEMMQEEMDEIEKWFKENKENRNVLYDEFSNKRLELMGTYAACLRSVERREEMEQKKEAKKEEAEAKEVKDEEEAKDDVVGEDEAKDDVVGEDEAKDGVVGEDEAKDGVVGEEEAKDGVVGEEEVKDGVVGEDEVKDDVVGEEEVKDKKVGKEENLFSSMFKKFKDRVFEGKAEDEALPKEL